MKRSLVAPRALVAVLALSQAVVGCSRQSDDAKSTPLTVERRPATAPPDSLRAGDVRIVTVDSGVDLALIGDSISAGLSATTVERVRRETDTAALNGTGFGASIERMVKSTVASAIGTRVSFPVSAVRDVRYEGGELKFDWVGKPVQVFAKSKSNGRPVMQSFRPDDAQRFVEAVRARKRALGVRP